jgi:hypothetical protein
MAHHALASPVLPSPDPLFGQPENQVIGALRASCSRHNGSVAPKGSTCVSALAHLQCRTTRSADFCSPPGSIEPAHQLRSPQPAVLPDPVPLPLSLLEPHALYA